MTTPSEIQETVEQILERRYFDIDLEHWAIALVILVGLTLILGVIKRVAQHRLAAIAERTDNDIDDLIADLVKRTKRFFLLTIAFYVAAHFLVAGSLAPDQESAGLSARTALWVSYVRNACKIAVILQVGVWMRGVMQYAIRKLVSSRPADDPARTMGSTVLSFIGSTILWSVVVLLCLSNVGVDVTALITGLGVGGIAVALALQNVLGDLFASIAILLDKPFVVGDAIQVGDFSGTIERIGVKTTRLRSVTGEMIVMGNADLVTSRVRNFKQLSERRGLFTVGITYDTPYELAARVPLLLREIVRTVPNVRFDRAHLKSLGDSALVYELVFFVEKEGFNELMDAQQAINLEIYRRFSEEGIEFAFPTQVVRYVETPLKSVEPVRMSEKDVKTASAAIAASERTRAERTSS